MEQAMSRDAINTYRAAWLLASLFVFATTGYVFAADWTELVSNPAVVASWEKLVLSLGLGVVMSLIMAGLLILVVRFVLLRNERREQRLIDLLEVAQANMNRATVDHAVAASRAMSLYEQSCHTLQKIADEVAQIARSHKASP